MKNKAFIVTGADCAAGRAWADFYVANGASVTLAGANYAACLRAANALGKNAIAVNADISCAAGWLSVVHAALDAFGRIDDVYNDGGIHDPSCEDDDAPAKLGARNGVRVAYHGTAPGERQDR